MNKYEVTLHFPSGNDIIVEAEGKNMDQAIARAKEMEQASPTIATTARRIENRGGARPGAGNKPGSKRVAEPRHIRKYIRWTDAEWKTIVDRAAVFGMSTTEFQRKAILNVIG